VEHPTLHALGLFSTMICVGGAVLVLGLLRPGGAGAVAADWQGCQLATVARWTRWLALLGSAGSVLDLLVQVAETEGQSLWAGVPLGQVVAFATGTTVGRFAVARALVLLGASLALQNASRWRWRAVAALGGAAFLCTILVSHAAAQPARGWPLLLLHSLHVGAAFVWLGVLTHWVVCQRLLREAARTGARVRLLATMVTRFTPVALGAVPVLLLSGGLQAVQAVGTLRALVTSAYGLTLNSAQTCARAARLSGRGGELSPAPPGA